MNCPVCSGEGQSIGMLGFLWHLKCRACGWFWSVDARLVEDDPAPDALEEQDYEDELAERIAAHEEAIDAPEPYEPSPYDGTYSEE